MMSTAILTLALSLGSANASVNLPEGNAPVPVSVPHFPDRVSAFVWRNWSLVPVERMAKVIAAQPVDILRIGKEMGLPDPPAIPDSQWRRSYTTIIRRNWHLLPYDQILQLLGWTTDQLAFTLREDDFLYIKLGNRKPKCEPIVYKAPDDKTLERLRQIGEITRREFAPSLGRPSAPLFDFVRELSAPLPKARNTATQPTGRSRFSPRFCYSYFALYGDPLLDSNNDPYPDGYLARLAVAGVDGVWLQAVLYKLAPFPWDAKLSTDYEQRLENLRRLVARARTHGIRVYLYLDEPRAMPLAFFKDHPDFRGVVEGDHAALCTSVPAVQKYLTDSVASICRAVPDLGGFFTITAAENLTNCWSHCNPFYAKGEECPRCKPRGLATVVAEVNALYQAGIERSSGKQKLIVWDWIWADDQAAEAIRRLPSGVSLMSVSEWSLPIERGGVKSKVTEYSISSIGPGPRAQENWKVGREREMPCIAKIQASNTWELSAVPYIPAVANVAQHVANLRDVGVTGLMLGWTLGGYPSPNLEVVAEMGRPSDQPGRPTVDEAMEAVAQRRFGAKMTPAVVRAWRQFSEAFQQFPFDQRTLYSAPLQTGPANLLWAKPTGYQATMVGFPYDHLAAWRSIYPSQVFIDQLEKVARGFEEGIAPLETLHKQSPTTDEGARALGEEIDVARAVAIHLQSIANQSRFIMARDALAKATTAETTRPLLTEIERALRSEIDLARQLYAIQQRDSRIGFEASNQYNYVPLDLVEKVINCCDLLDRWLPAERKKWTSDREGSQTLPATTRSDTADNQAAFLTDVFSFKQCYREQLGLDGVWEFRRDKESVGKERGWHEGKDRFNDTIKVPGVPQAQGIGEPDGRQKHAFFEPFWVRRTFKTPELTTNQCVWLRIGGIFPAAEIYLNGRYVGYTKSSRTQQRVDVSSFLKSGASNLIAIKVCDLPSIRLDGMFEWRELSMVWSGVYRSIALEITDPVSVVDVYVQPRLASKSVHVSVGLSEPSAEPLLVSLDVRDEDDHPGSVTIHVPAGQTSLEADVSLSGFTAWSPSHPKLYTLDVAVRKRAESPPIDRVPIRFGMREVSTTSNKFYLNGKPLYVRCFGDMQLYLDTIAPPPDTNWYLPRLKRAQQYGFNMAKSCVEVFTQDFVEAADEAGIMIIQEFPLGVGPLRANRYTIDEPFRKYFSSELPGMIKETRNHPSVVAYSMSSELEFANQTQESFNFFSRDLCRQTKQMAPHALVIDCTGYLDTETTKKGVRITDFYASLIPTWCKEVLDETPVNSDRKHPTILHEFNWWSCYPDPLDEPKYAHTQMLAPWFEWAVQTARANGQEDLIPAYRRISLRLQALCRKDGLEYARRCSNVEGYILWSLIDFHQYVEGLLDDFWEPKNVSSAEMLKSTGDTVIILAREGSRCLPLGAHSSIPLAISHYGENDLSNSLLRWKLSKGPIAKSGEIRVPALERGEVTQAGAVEFDLPQGETAYGFELEVDLRHDGGGVNTNNWSFWAFPQVKDPVVEAITGRTPGAAAGAVAIRTGATAGVAIPADVELVVADSLDGSLVDYVQAGGKCILFSRGSAIENTACYYQTTTFYPLFRSIPWNAGPGNSGTMIAKHPALQGFPCDEMCDLQFIWMIRGVLPMEFSPLRKYGVSPIIRAIDWYRKNMNNAYLLEFRVGNGKVLVTTLGVLPNVDKRIEANHLLHCLTDYARGPAFKPSASVPKAEFLKWFSQRVVDNKAKRPDNLLK